MLSVTEIKRKLPKDFIDSLYDIYTPVTVDRILSGMSGERNTTIRANNIKSDIQEIMRILKKNNIKFQRVEWYKDGLEIKNAKEKDIQKLLEYDKGFIYVQSLSSMIPPIVLNPKAGEKILDMTAAPGSKTTQIASMMQNEGEILANELDTIRLERLKYNIEKQSARIVTVINERGEVLGKKYPQQFDKILLDAPCSGEGRFLANDARTYRNWSARTVTQLAKLQKKLLKSACEAVRTNGIIIYSTCTLNLKENEEVLDWAIKNLPVKIMDIEIEIKEKIAAFTENMDKSIGKAIRILPTKSKEGFFIAKLKKT